LTSILLNGTPANRLPEKLRRQHAQKVQASRRTESEDYSLMRSKLFTLALSSAMTLCIGSAVVAQEPAAPPPDQAQPGPGAGGPRHMDPDQQLKHLTNTLDLSADQQSQIKPILVDRDQQMQAVFADQSLAQPDRRTKARSIMQESNGKIEAILNDQQKQKYEEMQQHMRRGGAGGPPPPPPAGGSPQQ
jgi:periplasmic protein CpxP/Spy